MTKTLPQVDVLPDEVVEELPAGNECNKRREGFDAEGVGFGGSEARVSVLLSGGGACILQFWGIEKEADRPRDV